jgi:acyl-CoA thioester hydrolase
MDATGYTKTYDLDGNRHVRSSAYNDFAAGTRLSGLTELGIGMDWAQAHAMAPVVFRDEIDYRRELRFGDLVTVTMELSGLSEDASRWRIEHRLLRADGVLSARIRCSGAWFDLNTRKLMTPPAEVRAAMNSFARTDDFEVLGVGS